MTTQPQSRTFLETFRRSIRAALSTPPHTWYRQWKRRNRGLSGTFDSYLKEPAEYTQTELVIAGLEVMQDWERPLMKALAQEAARGNGHILEIGFGMGISARYVVAAGCSRYTLIEPHPEVLERARAWADRQPIPVQIIEGFWQDVIDELGTFDGILFDPIAVSSEEGMDRLYAPFIPKASIHLEPGGVFTFFSATSDRLPPHNQKLNDECFSEYRCYNVEGLKPPKDCQYYQSSKMPVPVCVKWDHRVHPHRPPKRRALGTECRIGVFRANRFRSCAEKTWPKR